MATINILLAIDPPLLERLKIKCSDFTLTVENDTKFDEAASAIISKKGCNFNVTVIYSKPRANKRKFLEDFDEFLETNFSKILPQIICGEFNTDTLQKID